MKTTLRDHQETAVSSAIESLVDNDRCKIIMPCGTGKTLIGIKVSEILGCGYRMLVQAPSLALIKQLLDKYISELPACEIMVVCSDDTTAEEARQVYDIQEATTDAAKIAERMAANESLLVFCTYQSTERIAEAITDHGSPGFDFALFDEAHRMVGAASAFNAALDESRIPIFKRLFMTATPRFASSKDFDGYEYASMDDESQFGAVAYEMRLSDAIAADHLTDYEVCIFIVKESEIQSEIADNESMMDAAKRLAVCKAIQRRDLRKLLIYHNRVTSMKRFSRDEMPSTFLRMKEQGHVSGRLWSRALDGKDSASRRGKVLAQFATLNGDSRALLNNCRVLQEGVDVPAIDGIILLDPRSNVVDLMQMIGRMIRKSPSKKIATLVMPVFVPAEFEESIDAFVASSEFSHVYDLIAALKSHDDRIASWVSKQKRGEGDPDPPIVVEGIDDEVWDGAISKNWMTAIECRVVSSFESRPPLTEEQIWLWMQEYFRENREWPTARSDSRTPDGRTWCSVQTSMERGYDSLPGQSSLAKFRKKMLGEEISLTEETIWQWMQKYFEKHEKWPSKYRNERTPEGGTWRGVNTALWQGHRGLPGGSSLLALRQKMHPIEPSIRLSESVILEWMRKHFKETGKFPCVRTEEVTPEGGKWIAVNSALGQGLRGLPGGSSLAKLRKKMLASQSAE